MKNNLHMLRILAILTIALAGPLALAGCERASTPPAGTGTPGAEDPALLFRDNFKDPSSGWSRVQEPNGVTDYYSGVYRIFVNTPNTDIWARPGLNFTDTRIEVDAYRAGGEDNNRFGLLCRANTESSFYVFMISSDGYYGIGKIKGSSYELIGMDSLLPSEAINTGTATNRVRADCVGDRLSLWVNDVLLQEVQDDEFTSGDVGLIAGTYGAVGTDIHFSNFVVSAPPQPTPEAVEP